MAREGARSYDVLLGLGLVTTAVLLAVGTWNLDPVSGPAPYTAAGAAGVIVAGGYLPARAVGGLASLTRDRTNARVRLLLGRAVGVIAGLLVIAQLFAEGAVILGALGIVALVLWQSMISFLVHATPVPR